MKIKKLAAALVVASGVALSCQTGALAQGAQLGGPEGEQQQAAESAAAPAGNPQITAFVESQFPAADADKNGTLTAMEFTAWISTLKTAELQKAGQPIDAAAVKSYADSALAAADKDKDATVSKAELVGFFGG